MDDNLLDVAYLIVSNLVHMCPKDTWNLVNTIGFVIYDDNTIEIQIGGRFADYACYTNDKFYPNHPNNYHWVNRALEQVGLLLAEKNLGVCLSYV
jgi:hypothetical protein